MINNGRGSDTGELVLRGASQRVEFRLLHNSTPETDWRDKAVRERGKKRAEKEEASVSVAEEDKYGNESRNGVEENGAGSQETSGEWEMSKE